MQNSSGCLFSPNMVFIPVLRNEETNSKSMFSKWFHMAYASLYKEQRTGSTFRIRNGRLIVDVHLISVVRQTDCPQFKQRKTNELGIYVLNGNNAAGRQLDYEWSFPVGRVPYLQKRSERRSRALVN